MSREQCRQSGSRGRMNPAMLNMLGDVRMIPLTGTILFLEHSNRNRRLT